MTLFQGTLLSFIPAFILVFMTGCSSSEENKPEKCFTPELQAKIIAQSVRYSAKLAPQATHETKFDTTFNWYYDLAAKEYDLRACRQDKDSGYFFLMTRKARSIWPAREAIGGKLRLGKDQRVIDYAEEFRTWKMAEDSLNSRAFELFDLMVDGKDLTPYRSKFKGDRYIEFPDDRSFWDRNAKRWRDKFMIDSLRVN